MAHTLFTIGHSNHTLAAFIALLKRHDIVSLADIRTIPRSRHNPQFNRDSLPQALAAEDIHYHYFEDLGGLRGKSKDIPVQINAYWHNDSFHRYADYTAGASFAQALDALLSLSRQETTAIMCAEALWWRCHRRIVADYALARGLSVVHILSDGKPQPAQLSPQAVIEPDGRLTYPAPDPDPEGK